MKALQQKWAEITRDLVANVTRIRGRDIYHHIFDVTAFSPLSFVFKGQLVRRGWVESFIAGDTSIGKSDVAAKLSAHYGAPRPFRCENVSHAGLVGGAQNNGGGRFVLTWGLFPRMDKRMVVLEEVSSLPIEVIAQLSDVRSSGVASIIKISGGETMARVRKVFIFNPRRQGKGGGTDVKVSEFAHGVMVVPQVIGLPEDVRRFDCGTVAQVDEVPLSVINTKTEARVKHTYTTEAASTLLLWAWSRTVKDYVFQPGVEDRIIDLAVALCEKYSPDIPLVEPGEQRFKVARIAASLATRFHSTDKTGQKVLITKDHVDLTAWFLAECYDRPACGYDKYSERQRAQTDTLTSRDYEAILGSLGGENVGVLLDAVAFSEDLAHMPVVDFKDQASLLRKLVGMGLVRQTARGLQKTRKFAEFYKTFSEKSVGRK